MDPFDVIGNLHNIKPVFQPVIGAIDHDVIGYEVLGRIQDEDRWKSLGPFSKMKMCRKNSKRKSINTC